MPTSGIYEIRNKVTGHRYIGSSIDVRNRKYQHWLRLRRGTHHSTYLQRAWDKWGEDAFEFQTIEEVPDVTKLVEREQYWIETVHPCYNMNPLASSNLGLKTTEVTKARLREYNLRPEVIAKKKAEQMGHPVAPETIEKIKAARAKQETTEGMLQALARGRAASGEKKAARKGQKNSAEHNRKIAEKATGRKHTSASIQKMSETKRGKKLSEEHKHKIAESGKGRTYTDEQKKRISESNKVTWNKKKQQGGQ